MNIARRIITASMAAFISLTSAQTLDRFTDSRAEISVDRERAYRFVEYPTIA